MSTILNVLPGPGADHPTIMHVTQPGVIATSLPPETYDAMGRARVSNLTTLFDSKQVYSADTLAWNTKTVGTGSITYSQTHARSRLAVATAGDSALRQTYSRFLYQPGKSQLIFMTGVIRVAGTFSNGVSSRIGSFSTTDGLFFEYSSGSLKCVVRKASVDTLIEQVDWNLDPLDGTGPSGVTIDPTQSQIFIIEYQWLGVGSVHFGVSINGAIIMCHRRDNANVNASVYMSTPNLPLSYEIVSTSGSGSLDSICASVNSEGGLNLLGVLHSYGRFDLLNANTVGVEYVALMLRFQSASAAQYTINDISQSIIAATNDNYIAVLRLVRDSTVITNFGTQTWTAITGSPLEASTPIGNPGDAVVTADTLSSASGHILNIAYGSGNSSIPALHLLNSLTLGMSIDGVSDLLVLSIIPLGASLDVYAAMTWHETV